MQRGRLISLHERRRLRDRGAFEVHLQDVGQWHPRFPAVVCDVVIERDRVPGGSQALARNRNQFVRFHALQDLYDCVRGREQRDSALQQELPGAVDERTLSVTQDVKTHQQRAVERAASGCVRITASEEILDAIPEEQFITDHLLLAIQNGLAGHEPKALKRPGAKRLLCRRSGHSQWIG